MPCQDCTIVAAVVVLALVIVVVCARSKKKGKAGFYTGYAEEEPTRSYVPYTGTIPYGVWGVKPWAELSWEDMAPLYEDAL